MKLQGRFGAVFFCAVTLSTAQAAAAAVPSVQTYEALLKAIRQTRQASQSRIQQTVEQEKLREVWETGKLIDQHILLQKERQAYGQKVIIRLAGDLNTSETELRYMCLLARNYPIHPPADELSWSHHRELLSVEDSGERLRLARQAQAGNWTRDQLREAIAKKQSPPKDASTALLKAQAGVVGLYKISKNVEGELFVDLGFSTYRRLEPGAPFQEGEGVEIIGDKLQKSSQPQESFFTYRGKVRQVLDGDTLRVEVDLGFGLTTVQKLRLRGIDTPEIVRAEGQEAKAFVEKKLLGRESSIFSREKKSQDSPLKTEDVPIVLIKTHRSDKYDRYLADVWVGETYLNQALLDEGLAVRVSE